MTHDELLTPDELLEICDNYSFKDSTEPIKALRAIVELAIQPLDVENMPAQEVAWYTTGYNVALIRVLDVIAKELA